MLTLKKLAELWQRDPAAAEVRVREFALGEHHFAFNSRPSIMGVINLSPDSWYRESVCLSTDRAVQRGLVLHAQGAEVVDVGAESTLAQAARVDATQQQSRLVPVVRALREAGVIVSVEAYSTAVARAALEAGARVINLTGTAQTAEFYHLAAAHDAAVIVCYVQGDHVRAVGDFKFSDDPVALMSDYFARQIDLAAAAGVNKVLVDPGLGFYYRNLEDSAVRVRHQMTVFLNTFRLRVLGCPICHALPHAFEFFGDEVRTAEAFFCVLAALGQTSLFRTHEVPRIRAVLDTLQVF